MRGEATWSITPGCDGAQQEADRVARFGLGPRLPAGIRRPSSDGRSDHGALDQHRGFARVDLARTRRFSMPSRRITSMTARIISYGPDRRPVVLHRDQHDVVHALLRDQVVHVIVEDLERTAAPAAPPRSRASARPPRPCRRARSGSAGRSLRRSRSWRGRSGRRWPATCRVRAAMSATAVLAKPSRRNSASAVSMMRARVSSGLVLICAVHRGVVSVMTDEYDNSSVNGSQQCMGLFCSFFSRGCEGWLQGRPSS